MRPRSGRIKPAMAFSTVVLPAPDGPNSAVAPPVGAKGDIEREVAQAVIKRDVEAFRVATRRPTNRARISEPISAAIDIAIEIRVRRMAPLSPPGTWVKV